MPPRRAKGARGGDGGTGIIHLPQPDARKAAVGRPGRHTHGVGTESVQGADGSRGAAITERLVPLLDSTFQVWSSPQERRRLRAFGFRPAVEALRVVPEAGGGELMWSPGSGLTLDGGDFEATQEGIALADAVNGLIQSYERWIEAREGREERLRRGHWSATDRRQVNALAETRRLQRLLSTRAARTRR